MNKEKVYKNERVIGHHVSARCEDNKFGDVYSELDIEPMFDKYITIKEGDVDWNSGTRKVRLTPAELKEIYEYIFEENGDDT